MPKDAVETLTGLLGEGFKPEGQGQVYDTLRLLGLVLAQMALLEIITSKEAEDSDRVAAARLLLNTKESPEGIADRLRKSSFAGLKTEELANMIQQVKKGDQDIQGLIQSLK